MLENAWILEDVERHFGDFGLGEDKHVSIECYAQRLRARLALETQDSQGMVSESRSWRASRSTGVFMRFLSISLLFEGFMSFCLVL